MINSKIRKKVRKIADGDVQRIKVILIERE